ncbi:MAG: hypothetical protein GY810_20290 [Aureispira sp.]|nr:hypothetical protein [Aureispira sp.]
MNKLLFFLGFSILFSLSNMLCAQTQLISPGDNWKYYDAGNAPSGSWKTLGYNDATWASGNAELGYGDGDETTTTNSSAWTTYFRKTINVTNPSQYTGLNLKMIRDDGAVVYLNGTEIWRNNMGSGTPSYSTFANATVNNADESTWQTLSIPNNLLTGNNTIAVEMHQITLFSSDISFDFEMTATSPSLDTIIRGPYLQKGTPTSVVVRWRTGSFSQSVINYGTSLNNLNMTMTDTNSVVDHEIELTGLTPNTVYYYEIANQSSVLDSANADMYFKTAPVSGSSTATTRIWALGDCGTSNNNQRAVRDAYYNYIGNQHTDVLLFLGDNAYQDGKDSEYQTAVFENMYEDMLKKTVAWSTMGNHDGHSANSGSQSGPYYDIFTFPTLGEAGGSASGTEAYYSFDYRNIHFIVLNSEDLDRSVGGTMYNWCQNDIQNTNADWIIALWHHPPYTKGSHNSDIEPQLIQMRVNFLPMLEDNGVDLVLCGHSHSYERSYFINGHDGFTFNFDTASHIVGVNGYGDGRIGSDGAYQKTTVGPEAGDGAVYITAGSSGKTSGSSLNHPAMFSSLDELGSCVVEVTNNQLDMKFVRENGVIDDYFTIIKSFPTSTTELEIDPKSTFKIHPNPASDNIRLDSPLPFREVHIFDRVGNEVKYIKGNPSTIDISELAIGMYIVAGTTESGKHLYQKLVIK